MPASAPARSPVASRPPPARRPAAICSGFVSRRPSGCSKPPPTPSTTSEPRSATATRRRSDAPSPRPPVWVLDRTDRSTARDDTIPSGLSVVSCGVEVLELDAGVLGGEPPVDPTTGPVAGRLPRRDLPLQGRPVGQATVQALPGQHGQLDLGHVQPAAVPRGVVQL